MKIIPSIALAFLGIGHTALAHEIVVHKAITEHAAASALNFSSSYSTFVNIISSDCAYESARAEMVNGSAYEDNFRNEVSGEPDAGGMRSLNHFYDPLTGLGLSNIPIDDRLRDMVTGQFVPVGRDSFTWASTRDCPGVDIRLNGFGVNANTLNIWSWQNARDKQWIGLTAETHAARQTALLEMFRAVGQAVHLLEDASQPEHTRNEQHLWPGSPIEEYGGKHLRSLNYQHGMLDWRAAGFTKMKDFWDRDLYNGDGATLDEDAGGGAKLGLAEFSNGNFLGARHQYPEYFNPGSVQHYPLPSRDNSTNYKQVKANPSIGLDTYMLGDREVKGIYIKKNSDGITGIYLSRINYLGAKKFSGLAGKAFCTIKDDNVLADYHSVMIPKAIEYSAGLLDYYFRGQLEVLVGVGNSPGTYSLQIKNVSGEKFLGGTFALFWDDVNGNRFELIEDDYTTSHSSTSSLEPNASTTATFVPHPDAVQYLLIYRGSIGATASAANDPVDANIAIAVKRLNCFPETGDPVPDPLEQPDNTIMGEVSIYDAPVSFGNVPPGYYQIEYVEGALDLWAFDDTAHYYYLTKLCSGFLCESRVLIDTSLGPLNGVSGGTLADDLDAVQTATLALNPVGSGAWDGGVIHLAIHDSYSIAPDEFAFHPPGATYRLRRVAKPFEQPERVRIKNWETEVKPLITICASCPDSNAPEWDGSFPDQDGWWDWPQWYNYDVTALHGKAMDWVPEVYYGFDAWYLTFYCGSGQVVWSGRKDVGNDATGRYIQDLISDPNQCATGVGCIVLESY